MHQPDSDGVVRSCTPLQGVPDVTGLTESYPLMIRSVTYFNAQGQPQYVQETWLSLDQSGKAEFISCEQWFCVADALAPVEEK